MILNSSSKLIHHSDRVADIFEKGHTYPVHITVGLTNYCNHKCTWCYIDFAQDKENYINADITKMVEALKCAKSLGTKAITIVGDGEPTLHPEFGMFIKLVRELGLDIGLFTNGGWKNTSIGEDIKKYLTFIRFSMDAATFEMHKNTHHTNDFNQVIQNIKSIAENTRKDLTVGVQFAFNEENQDEILEATKLYGDLSIDYLAFKPVYKNELNVLHKENEVQEQKLIASLQNAKRLETSTFRVYWKEWQMQSLVYDKLGDRGYDKCRAIWLSPYFDENGNVEFCGNLKGRGFTIGNIYEKSFDKVWLSEQHFAKVDKIELEQCPVGCKLHGINLELEKIANPNPNGHINFV